MAFCWENGFHGVMSDDGEFIMFNPPKYFSAHDIKLSFQQDLNTTEFKIEKMAKECRTISNEILTSISSRVKRNYI